MKCRKAVTETIPKTIIKTVSKAAASSLTSSSEPSEESCTGWETIMVVCLVIFLVGVFLGAAAWRSFSRRHREEEDEEGGKRDTKTPGQQSSTASSTVSPPPPPLKYNLEELQLSYVKNLDTLLHNELPQDVDRLARGNSDQKVMNCGDELFITR